MAYILSDDIFKSSFLNENVWISIIIWVKSAAKAPFANNPLLFHGQRQVIAWNNDDPVQQVPLSWTQIM